MFHALVKPRCTSRPRGMAILAERNARDLRRMLLDHGARLDLRDDLLKSTPLGWACRWGRKELVELLIARGAPVNEPDAEPWATPRAWAEKMKQRRCARGAAGRAIEILM